jgi:hypothetical protein
VACTIGDFDAALVLKLSLEVRRGAIAAPFPVTDHGGGLIQASPQGPSQDVLELQAGELLQAADEMADFIRAEIDQRSSSGCPFLPLAVTAAAAALRPELTKRSKL